MADSLNRDLSCTICAEMYTDPVTLDCGHNFCKACILELWGAAQGTVSCPQCGQQFPRRELMTNQLLVTIVASLRRLNLEAGAGDSGLRCPVHSEQAKLFCSKDLKLVCSTCLALGEEGSPTLIPVEEAYTFCKGKLENLVEFLEKRLEEYCEAQSARGSDITETLDIKRFLQRSDLHNEPILQSPGMCVGEFNGPLQYAAWKQMLSIIRPAPAPLTLDSETANPCLILSKDHTMVKHRTKFKQLPDTPKRFTFCASVLATEGFTSGRHYWEVDVENMSGWIVGAAKESVSRSDDVPLTPANGFWTVRLWNGKVHFSHGSSGALCCADVQPERIGVYLDYEGGQLSFYNAADMSHLYTFSDHFVEKLYPFLFPLPNLERAEAEILKLFHLYL
ncbi:zinc-binding protein A33-like isoform X2 [Heterodontus francisci]|uniref:zinc-binding protein A33-like isoform X2 n=1 Tax=Heterodontus francisci TaxID=7792 RepID=UPI00355B3188